MIRYYVGFMLTTYGTTRTRGREVTCRRPLRSMEDVLELQDELEKLERGDAFILGFSVLHDDEPATDSETSACAR